MVPAMMGLGSAFICVDVDRTARLDTPDEDKEFLLHSPFYKNLLAVVLQVPLSSARLLMYVYAQRSRLASCMSRTVSN